MEKVRTPVTTISAKTPRKPRKKTDDANKTQFPLDAILTGTYSCGHWARYKYFQVVGFTKNNAPRVVEIKSNVVSDDNGGALESVLIKTIDTENIERLSNEIYSARWSEKDNDWGVTIQENWGKERASLEPFVAGQVDRETSYY